MVSNVTKNKWDFKEKMKEVIKARKLILKCIYYLMLPALISE